MENIYFILIIVVLLCIVTGLSVGIFCLRRRLIHLSKRVSQSHYEKVKMQLLMERMQKQLDKDIQKDNPIATT